MEVQNVEAAPRYGPIGAYPSITYPLTRFQLLKTGTQFRYCHRQIGPVATKCWPSSRGVSAI